jgi:glycosyltransferase involved in cell wall biosynthesis
LPITGHFFYLTETAIMSASIDYEYYRKKITALNACVIIPTYNNQQTIANVINDVLKFTTHIIVVNDGATDSTSEILNQFSALQIISYSPNRGKGIALRTGIKAAQEKGYRYAITIDSDGQHYADDIPVFITKIEQTPDALLIGARNLHQENMPKKNTFGNKFSNFWFHFQTGIHLPDTQSGYRLYPLEKIKKTRYFTSKYEFEIEVMVKAAWRGVQVMPVPINVFYAEGDKRITHFRPGKDFTRISILNTYLTIIALLWYKPIRLIKGLSFRNIKAVVNKQLLDPSESPMRKSVGVAFGVFMGIIPLWGFQFVSALILAHFMKLNKAIVGLAAQISIPPMIPFLLYGSLKTGQWVLGREMSETISTEHLTLTTVKQLLHEYLFSGKVLDHLYEYLLGSMIFATVLAIGFGGITYLILKLTQKTQNKQTNSKPTIN